MPREPLRPPAPRRPAPADGRRGGSATAQALRRLLAGWLVALLLVQGLAAGEGLGQAWHRHRALPVALQAAQWVADHDALHQDARRHRHGLFDASVLRTDTEEADGSAGRLLAAALSTALPSLAAWPLAAGRHARPADPTFRLHERPAVPPRRPPRA